MKFWLGVVSKEHVLRGLAGNYVQVCHGKGGPLRKMKPGDGFVYYSPVNAFKSKDKLQAFTAIGVVKDGNVYQVKMFENFEPFRCDVEFIKSAKEVPISQLKQSLKITQGNWGMLFRRGHIEVPLEDFKKIAEAMGVNFEKAFLTKEKAVCKEEKEEKKEEPSSKTAKKKPKRQIIMNEFFSKRRKSKEVQGGDIESQYEAFRR